MTTTDLAQRLLRYTKFSDLANVPADDALEILEAISTGIRDWCMLVPTDFRRRSITGTLKAKATLGGCVFKAGSKEFTPSANLNAFIGATCQIAGESEYNRIVDNGKLLFEAETSGSGSLEYWRDFIDLGRASRLVSAPLIRGNRLRMWNDQDRDHHTGNLAGPDFWRTQDSSATGEPRRYWVDTENSSNTSPRFIVRMWPLPNKNEQVSLDVDIHAPRYGLTTLKNPEHIPIPDEYCESIILPLAARELLASPMFSGNASAVDQRGKRAERRASALIPVSATSNKVYTPANW